MVVFDVAWLLHRADQSFRSLNYSMANEIRLISLEQSANLIEVEAGERARDYAKENIKSAAWNTSQSFYGFFYNLRPSR